MTICATFLSEFETIFVAKWPYGTTFGMLTILFLNFNKYVNYQNYWLYNFMSIKSMYSHVWWVYDIHNILYLFTALSIQQCEVNIVGQSHWWGKHRGPVHEYLGRRCKSGLKVFHKCPENMGQDRLFSHFSLVFHLTFSVLSQNYILRYDFFFF